MMSSLPSPSQQPQQPLPCAAAPSSAWAVSAVGLSLTAVLGLTLPFVLTPLRSPLPYMATPRHKVVRALQFLEDRLLGRAKTQSRPRCFRLYDLGSGDGDVVLTAAKRPLWTATGIELNGSLWFVSQLRRMATTSARPHVQLIWGNFFDDVSLQDATAVYVFGVPRLMPRVAQKLANECAPGTFVLAYRFPVPTINNTEGKTTEVVDHDDDDATTTTTDDAATDDGGLLDADLIYNVEEMRIYELRGEASSKK